MCINVSIVVLGLLLPDNGRLFTGKTFKKNCTCFVNDVGYPTDIIHHRGGNLTVVKHRNMLNSLTPTLVLILE